MWADRRPPPATARWWPPSRPPHTDWGLATDPLLERAGLAALVAGAALATLALGTGHVAALLFGGGWPRYHPSEIPGLLWRLATSPDDPGAAWAPINHGADVPGPLAWWATYALLATTLVWSGIAVTRARRGRPGAAASDWARARDLRRLRVRYRQRGRLVIGRAGRRRVAVESRHSLLVLGPTQSGKTTGLAIPTILEWPGPVLATSVKGDLVDDTIGWRSHLGDVHVFDPGRVTRHRPSGWSPLAGCATWDRATRSAWDLAMAGKAAVGGGMNLADFWFSSAAKSLAPLLHAAAHTGRSIGDVARWVDREERDEVLDVLHGLEPDATLAYKATFRREDRARSSLFQVLQQIVGVYLDPQVAASAETNDIDAVELLDGNPHTLYITAPHHDQARLRPLFATLVRHVLTAVYDHASTGEPLRSPLLVVLDEAANIAPVEDLPTVASTAAAMGLQLVTVFQDLAQIRGRYGDATGTVVNNHRAKLVLPGLSDLDTLELASGLAGDQETERASITIDLTGRRSSTTATHWRRLLPPEAARQLPDGYGVLLYGNLAPMRVRLRPWHHNRKLRRRAHHPLDPLPTHARGPGPAPPSPTSAVPAAQPQLPLPPNVSTLDAARARLRRPPPDPGGDP
jgi:type IV secretory pathway TraG/TraD family ATPase VirD4